MGACRTSVLPRRLNDMDQYDGKHDEADHRWPVALDREPPEGGKFIGHRQSPFWNADENAVRRRIESSGFVDMR